MTKKTTKKTSLLSILILVLSLSVSVSPAGAHHAAAAMYNLSKQITLKGTVTRVEWSNPHIYFYLEVKSDEGRVVRYAVEGSARETLARQGWSAESLKIGDVITVSGFPAKDGSNQIVGRSATRLNGEPVYTGTAPQAH